MYVLANWQFLHVVLHFLIFEVCELYSDIKIKGLDILSIDSVAYLTPH